MINDFYVDANTVVVRVLPGSTPNISFKVENIFNNLNLTLQGTPPSWVTNNVDTGGETIDIDLSGAQPLGIYTLNFLDDAPPTFQQAYKLIIEVVSSLFDVVDTCEFNNITLVWLTREGGRGSYVFNQRKDYGIKAGDDTMFINNGVVKYSYRGLVYDSRTVYKTGLSNSEVDLLTSLRESIQAWEYNEISDMCIPIKIVSGDFPTTNTKQHMNEVVIKYILATATKIQSQ